MIPTVSITKSDGNTGVVKPGAEGILAIIAPSEKGDLNTPSAHVRQDLALAEFGRGKLVEFGAYDMAVAKKPVVLIRCDPSTAGDYGSVTVDGEPEEDASTITEGASEPLDDFDVLVTFLTAGTIGVAGITYNYSLDAGKTKSGTKALGTLTTLTIPNTGVSFDLGAGDIAAGETVSCAVTGPEMNNTDLADSLEALRTYNGAWDAVLVAMDADASTVSTLETWLSAREAQGKYKTAIVNAVRRDPGTQTEAQYATAMGTAFASASSTRVVVCADAGDLTSLLSGARQPRPVSLGLAARGMASDISTDAAYVSDGPITGYSIADDRGNPKYHDEALFPGLDDLRLATLRSFDGRAGAFINNPLLISPSGSDYVFWQHARVMNKACEVAFQLLTQRLSKGVHRDLKTGFITEEDALEIEGLVNAELEKQLVRPGRVSGAAFVLSRNDDLTSNAGATLNGEIQIAALAYVKQFAIVARFVKTISVAA